MEYKGISPLFVSSKEPNSKVVCWILYKVLKEYPSLGVNWHRWVKLFQLHSKISFKTSKRTKPRLMSTVLHCNIEVQPTILHYSFSLWIIAGWLSMLLCKLLAKRCGSVRSHVLKLIVCDILLWSSDLQCMKFNLTHLYHFISKLGYL